MFSFEKYNIYVCYFHLNKINLKNFSKKLKFFNYIIFVNDRKKETPKLFFHYYFSLIFYIVWRGQICFISKNLGKSAAQMYPFNFFFFYNKLFFKKSFWLI